MNSDDVAMLHTEVVSDNTVNTNTAVVKVVVCEDDKNGILPLLSLDQDCVTTEQLQSLHGIVRKGDDRVVVVNGIGHAAWVSNGVLLAKFSGNHSHQGVWLLLLLENSRGGVQLLQSISKQRTIVARLCFNLHPWPRHRRGHCRWVLSARERDDHEREKWREKNVLEVDLPLRLSVLWFRRHCQR